MRYQIKLVVIAAVIAAAGIALFTWHRPMRVQPAPDVTFRLTDGRAITLTDLRGRPVLVTFWASTCRECIREMPQMVRLYEELAPKGLEVIGVVIYYDRPDAALAVAKRQRLPYPVAIDIQAEVSRAFGNVQMTPTTFLVNPQGSIVRQRTGTLNFAALRREITAMLANNVNNS
ncbi:MAG: TlpA family protein disulfide reductase [Pseudomonadota bacterium]|nr:MAG: TlpA family protein disulfide reductase [Pseudomonadota bacterium]